ncbi:MAG TPA: hypothetical protein VGN36_04725, partial [Sphingorhabdus sp.]|nr:hypothetical protein [Sphingorhabdus sp.]
MRAFAALMAIWLAAFSLSASAQTTRALFVGIDSYKYSSATTQGASFRDLRGAVADTVRFKNTLRELYQMDLDRTPQGQCPQSQHPLSTTLLNT